MSRSLPSSLPILAAVIVLYSFGENKFSFG